MGWTGWETRSVGLLGSVCRNCSSRSLLCFGWFSLIRAENRSSFVFLDFGLFYKGYEKFLEPLSMGWTGWETRSIGALG